MNPLKTKLKNLIKEIDWLAPLIWLAASFITTLSLWGFVQVPFIYLWEAVLGLIATFQIIHMMIEATIDLIQDWLNPVQDPQKD